MPETEQPELPRDLTLLRLAREAAHGANPAQAVEYLEELREDVLQTQNFQRLHEAIPILLTLDDRYGAPARARDFRQSTVTRLDTYGRGQEFEQQFLKAKLDELESVRHPILPSLFLYLGLAISFGGVVALILGVALASPRSAAVLAGAIAAAAGLLLAGLGYVMERVRKVRHDAEIQSVRRKINVRSLSTSSQPPPIPPGAVGPAAPVGEYFTRLVQINGDNLSDYYAQVRVHTNNSFWASIVAGGLGFILIVIGLVFGLARRDAQAVSYVATASGVIVEFISGVFFYLYNRTVRQLKGYHDSLLDVQNILLSFRIVEQSAETQQHALFEQILRFLLQQKSQATDNAQAQAFPPVK